MARKRDYEDGDFDPPKRSSPYQNISDDKYEDDYDDTYDDYDDEDYDDEYDEDEDYDDAGERE